MLLYTSFRPARIGVDSMTTIFRIIFVFFLYLFVIAGLFVAEAHEFKVGTLDISHPWSRPTAEGQ